MIEGKKTLNNHYNAILNHNRSIETILRKKNNNNIDLSSTDFDFKSNEHTDFHLYFELTTQSSERKIKERERFEPFSFCSNENSISHANRYTRNKIEFLTAVSITQNSIRIGRRTIERATTIKLHVSTTSIQLFKLVEEEEEEKIV